MDPTPQSKEWREFRKKMIGASDAPIIMGISPFKTPYRLWQEKVGLVSDYHVSPSMQRGLDLEDDARNWFQNETGIKVRPCTFIHPEKHWMMATLDGISDDREVMLEIKCPGRKDHDLAMNGEIPEKYYPQIQHQWEVLSASQRVKKHFYLSYFDDCHVVLFETSKNVRYIHEMVQKEWEFYKCMVDFTPPESPDDSFEERSDDQWSLLAQEWIELQPYVKKEESVRSALIELAEGKNCRGCGLRLKKSTRKGAIDYAKIDAITQIDLEIYRKEPIEFWKISSEK